VISIDETDWKKVMSKRRCWGFKGQAKRIREDRGGK